MNDSQLLRYSRHILLPQIDVEGQERLLRSHMLIVGLGGLGSPCALYLAAAGVGELTLCDFDEVELSNLQRQIAHRPSRVGVNKARSAQQELAELNPECQVHIVTERVTADQVPGLVAAADVVVDCSDNFATRHLLNRACVDTKKPLVSGSAIQTVGQIAVFDLSCAECPCYACFVPEDAVDSALNCASAGVLGSLTGTIGSMQATEAIKCVIRNDQRMVGQVMLYDAWAAEWNRLPIRKQPDCGVCGIP